MHCNEAAAYLGRYMRKAWSPAKQGRDTAVMPDQIQTALRSALQQVPGMVSYYWRKTFSNRGHPTIRIIIQLGYGFNTFAASHAAIDVLHREMDDTMVNMFAVVTNNSRTFWSLREMELSSLE
jgi:hypothetical protein